MPTLGIAIAIVGAGMIGAVHRRAALLAGAEVRGVAASSAQRAREMAQLWNVPRAYRDIEEVIADPQVRYRGTLGGNVMQFAQTFLLWIIATRLHLSAVLAVVKI